MIWKILKSFCSIEQLLNFHKKYFAIERFFSEFILHRICWETVSTLIEPSYICLQTINRIFLRILTTFKSVRSLEFSIGEERGYYRGAKIENLCKCKRDLHLMRFSRSEKKIAAWVPRMHWGSRSRALISTSTTQPSKPWNRWKIEPKVTGKASEATKILSKLNGQNADVS